MENAKKEEDSNGTKEEQGAQGKEQGHVHDASQKQRCARSNHTRKKEKKIKEKSKR